MKNSHYASLTCRSAIQSLDPNFVTRSVFLHVNMHVGDGNVPIDHFLVLQRYLCDNLYRAKRRGCLYSDLLGRLWIMNFSS
jgi:hypothetical protein